MRDILNKGIWFVCAVAVVTLVNLTIALGQERSQEIPRIEQKDGRFTLLVDGAPFFVFGGQSNNSSTWPAMLPDVWNAIDAMNANTLEVPIYWEQVEPQPGQYNFSMVQLLLDQARERNKRLIILWFATWKNGSNHYMPEWMKKDAEKYPNIVAKDGQPVDSPSPHAEATMEADAQAFAEVMKYLKDADPQHTVIMVQIQNEPGAWGSVRDYSAAAQKLFEQPVPAILLRAKVRKELNVAEGAKGTWKEVFGNDADEYFQAWSVASYIEYVAAAGKRVNPLPMYVNVALRDPISNPPATNYESGGATDNVIPIWKVAAPSIDFLAPDIYLQGNEKVLKVIDLYAREDNALMVPETSSNNVKYLYKVMEKGIGYSPFGIDKRPGATGDHNAVLANEYRLFAPMMCEIATWGREGRIHSVVESEGHAEERIDLGNWEVVFTFGPARRSAASPVDDTQRVATGKAMIVDLGEDEFIVAGTECRITFNPVGKNNRKAWHYLKVKEGTYENGQFQMRHVLNGDQTDWGGPYIGENPELLHITLYTR